MKRFLPIIFLLAACTSGGLGGSDRDKFIRAVAAVDCIVDSDEAARAVEQRSGLPVETLRDIKNQLDREGHLRTAPLGGFILTTGPCAGR